MRTCHSVTLPFFKPLAEQDMEDSAGMIMPVQSMRRKITIGAMLTIMTTGSTAAQHLTELKREECRQISREILAHLPYQKGVTCLKESRGTINRTKPGPATHFCTDS